MCSLSHIELEAAPATTIDEQSSHPPVIQRKKTVATVVASVLALAIVIGVVLVAKPNQPVRATGVLYGTQDVVVAIGNKEGTSVVSGADQNQNLAETYGNITDSIDYCTNPNEGLCYVQFDTDNYPWENEWTLKDAIGNVVMSGPPKGQNYDRLTKYVKSMCVATGSYTIALTDKYEDGVCCEYGKGRMVVKVNGEVVASTGESSFEKFERTITVKPSSAESKDGYNHVTAYCQAACNDGICTYTALVDMFASEFGFFHFQECPDAGNMPTITMELGKTYRFIQRDISNYIHPLGFAYEPDGALAGANEVEEEYLSYQLNGEDIGLDGYEPNFAHPIDEWVTDGEYYVEVTIPEDFTYTKDLFYFCHIHRYLGGRIIFRNNGRFIQPSHLPIHNTMPPPRSSYDEQCGTYGLVHQYANLSQSDSWNHITAADYRLPHSKCPLTFVCEDGKSIFASCLDAINCHMFVGMTTYEQYSEVALFLQQMIPHHQNAVNMAKSLMLNWSYTCDPADLGSDSAECLMENILRSIVHGQNAQIQTMRDLLERNGWPEFDHCDRPIEGSSEDKEMKSEYENIDNSMYSGKHYLHAEVSDDKEYFNNGRGLGESQS